MKRITLLPADIYQVIDKSLLSSHDDLVLNMLYMPIIGNIAIVLYKKLQSEIAGNSYISTELSHHHLMTSTGLTLDNLKEARLKLEGIGLLKTYFHEGDINSYIYELYAPVSASEFFSHPIFNVVLYNNVGKSEYNRLFDFFKVPNYSLKEYDDITASFDSVYKSRNYTEFELNEGKLISKNKLVLNYEMDFDFDLLCDLIPKNLFNDKCLTKSMKELIINLSYLYEIDIVSFADLVKASLNEKGNIDKTSLIKNVRKFYQFNNDNRLPSLLFKSQREHVRSASGDNSNRGRMIRVFETNSPYKFLKAKYKGAKPTERDMAILEELLVDIKLNPAVINVLIDYILKTNNNKLVKAYVETLAGQWKRCNIETAEEAMNLAEKEHKKKYKVKETKKSSVTPTWFNTSTSSTPNNEETEEFKSFIEEFRK